MEKTVGIIGAGIAGLSAGCYARMNGYKTTLFEIHSKPGGLCTSWKQGDFTVDACIHWLCGSNPKSRMRETWDEVGALVGKTLVNHEIFTQVEMEGKVLKVYADLDRYEKHLLELSPQDAPLIRRYTKACRRIAFLDQAPEGTSFLGKGFGFLLGLATLLQYLKMPQDRFAARFKDPFLRKAFLNGFREMPDCPLIALMFTHALLHNKNAGYPIGGSLQFARAIEKRFLDLGGEIRYKAKVVKILVEQGKAVGVKLEDGSERRFDYVLSAADGHATLFEMLGSEVVDPVFKEMYAKWQPFPPLLYLSFGLNRDLSSEPQSLEMEFAEGFRVADREVRAMHVRHFCYDPTLAPAGKSVVIAMFHTSFEYWNDLKARDPQGYKAEKERVAAEVLKRLEVRFPGFIAAVEMKNVASPTTFVRYTGNWKGSFEGWFPTTKTLMKKVPSTLKRVRRFYMIGQWVKPGGGLPTALSSGRDIVRRICKEDGLRFQASKPARNSSHQTVSFR